MAFKEVTFKYVEEVLGSFVFHKEYKSRLDFLPNTICDWALKSAYQVDIEPIENWTDFEEGILDFSEEYFWNLIRKKYAFALDSRLIFISDECFRSKTAFDFQLKDYIDFVDYYEGRFPGSFFQPADYILIFPELSKIVMIYHEGKLVYVSNGNSD